MSRQRSPGTIENAEYVTVGELVRLTGARYSTLKFYTEQKMLAFEQPEENLTRRYKRVETIERIALIRQLREHGFSVSVIKEALAGDGFQANRLLETVRAFPSGTSLPEQGNARFNKEASHGKKNGERQNSVKLPIMIKT